MPEFKDSVDLESKEFLALVTALYAGVDAYNKGSVIIPPKNSPKDTSKKVVTPEDILIPSMNLNTTEDIPNLSIKIKV